MFLSLLMLLKTFTFLGTSMMVNAFKFIKLLPEKSVASREISKIPLENIQTLFGTIFGRFTPEKC